HDELHSLRFTGFRIIDCLRHRSNHPANPLWFTLDPIPRGYQSRGRRYTDDITGAYQIPIALALRKNTVRRSEGDRWHAPLLQREIAVGDIAGRDQLHILVGAVVLQRLENHVELRAPVAADTDHFAAQIFHPLNILL